MLQTHLLKDTRRRTREKEKLERKSKVKDGQKVRYKRPVKQNGYASAGSSSDYGAEKAKSMTSADSSNLYNMTVVEFINSPYVQKEVFPDEESFKRDLIDKMNKVAQCSSEHFAGEKYEMRFNREKESKYIQVRCARMRCKFSLWFNYHGTATRPVKISLARKINLAHSVEEH